MGHTGALMFEELDGFLEDCDLSGPLELEWVDSPGGESVRGTFHQPARLVGRHPKADLILDRPGVEPWHAYLQVVAGRLFAVDLGHFPSLRWAGVPRTEGWIDWKRPVQIGGVVLRVVKDGFPEELSVAGPSPLTGRYVSKHALLGAILEFHGGRGEPRRHSLSACSLLSGSRTLPDPVEEPECPAIPWCVAAYAFRGLGGQSGTGRTGHREQGPLSLCSAGRRRLAPGRSRLDPNFL